jgi:hypothetical protein
MYHFPVPLLLSIPGHGIKYVLYANDSTRQGSSLISLRFAWLVSSIQPWRTTLKSMARHQKPHSDITLATNHTRR